MQGLNPVRARIASAPSLVFAYCASLIQPCVRISHILHLPKQCPLIQYQNYA